MNPDFEYIFFDDADVESFIDAQYPQYRQLFDAFPYRIQKFDFFRYLAVYHFGGFYFDLDLLLTQPLDALREHGCVFPFERLTWSDYLRDRHAMDWELGNYAFGACAGDPFLRAIIDNCARAQRDPRWKLLPIASIPQPLRDDLEVIYSTGPGMVSRTFAEKREAASSVHVLFPDDVCDRAVWNLFGEYGVHVGAGGWRSKRGEWHRRLLGFLGRRNEERALRHARRIGPTRHADSVRGDLPLTEASA